MFRKISNAIITPLACGAGGAIIGALSIGGGAFFINAIFIEGNGVCEAVRRIAKEKGCSPYKGGAGIDGGRCDDLQLGCPEGTDDLAIWRAAQNDPSVPPSTLLEWVMYGAIGGAVLGFVIGFGTGVAVVYDGEGILIKKSNDVIAQPIPNDSKSQNENIEVQVEGVPNTHAEQTEGQIEPSPFVPEQIEGQPNTGLRTFSLFNRQPVEDSAYAALIPSAPSLG